jgi:hypothetical protein
MNMENEIGLTAAKAEELLEILTDVVVSFDRIGSREASGEDPEHTWIHEYCSTGGATRRLEHARYILDVAYGRVYSEDELEERWGERHWPAWGRPHPTTNITPIEPD